MAAGPGEAGPGGVTTQQKLGAGALATVLAVLTLVLSSQSLPVIQFMFGELRVFAGLPLFGPVLVAAAVGTVAPFWLPHLLPASWPAHRTLRVTRLLGFCIALGMVAVRYPSAIGVQYGLFAGSLAYMGYTMASACLYRRLGHKPCSLREDGDK